MANPIKIVVGQVEMSGIYEISVCTERIFSSETIPFILILIVH